MAEAYVHPEVLVSADWVEQHLDDPKVRIVESDEDVLLYDMGHIPGSVKVDWQGDLQDQLIRDYIDVDKFAAICSRAGIANDTTVVFYGDKSNWWACYAFWAFKLFGHQDCRVLNGGRKLWLDQKRATTTEVPKYTPTKYTVGRRDEAAIRAFRDEVLAHSKSGKPLLDVRSPKEFTGERTHMEDYPNEGLAPRRATSPAPSASPGPGRSTTTARSRRPRSLKSIYRDEVGLKPRGRHRRLLPDRRAFQPDLVRPHLPARLSQGPQL